MEKNENVKINDNKESKKNKSDNSNVDEEVIIIESKNVSSEATLKHEISGIMNETAYNVEQLVNNTKKVISAQDLNNKQTKNNIFSGVLLLVSLIIFVFAIRYFCMIEDTDILGKVCFDDKMAVVEEKYGDNYSVYADVEDGMVVWKYDEHEVNGIAGNIYYYFSEENTVSKVKFVFESEKENIDVISKYLKRHYGEYEKDSDGSLEYDGKNIKYSMKLSHETYKQEVDIESK